MHSIQAMAMLHNSLIATVCGLHAVFIVLKGACRVLSYDLQTFGLISCPQLHHFLSYLEKLLFAALASTAWLFTSTAWLLASRLSQQLHSVAGQR